MSKNPSHAARINNRRKSIIDYFYIVFSIGTGDIGLSNCGFSLSKRHRARFVAFNRKKNMENPSSRFINRVCDKKSSTRFDSLEDHRSTLDPIFYFFHFFCSIFEYFWLNSRLEICSLKFLKIVQKFYRPNFFQPSLNRSRSYPPMFVRVD